ncbi:HAD family hydrolase [Mitosporidium daphniae]|uniref:HAD family hydrolase n=1 Tax=Mitosporidium daphniae TaxID=1485682 RepID=A0A098VMH8_9MICR|nr:HAD family hydrolase [Mitosporidium daphniae]KGG50004.1 HAD family hydrolase [Mitosporidium daphniae]|eukprot:XP_013236440.1 HAD family hydrolase [Mitosporidium daphniae]
MVLGDDPSVKRGKPSPDIFIEAANRLAPLVDADIVDQGPFPDVLAFEDSPVGAARAAGMEVIWIPDPKIECDLFKHDPLVHYLPSMENFDPADWGLPPFQVQ